MIAYLVRRTKKHLTRAHIADTNNRPICNRASGVVAGCRGWELVTDYKPRFDEVCWHCEHKKMLIEQQQKVTK